MSASGQFVAHMALVALVLVLDPSRAQERIVFPEEDYVWTENRFPVRIPEKLLGKLNHVQNVADFLKRFVNTEEENIIEEKGEGRTINGSRHKVFKSEGRIISVHNEEKVYKSEPVPIGRNYSLRGRKLNIESPPKAAPKAAPKVVPQAEFAKCKPELQVVPVLQPADPSRIRWPKCMRIKRCGGCCYGDLRACTPDEVSYENFTVYDVHYDAREPDGFIQDGPVVISVEQHNKCSCKCILSPATCTESQKFDEDNCRCVCLNRRFAHSCTQHRVWDNNLCTCKCRHVRDCSTGRYFNEETCRCELLMEN